MCYPAQRGTHIRTHTHEHTHQNPLNYSSAQGTIVLSILLALFSDSAIHFPAAALFVSVCECVGGRLIFHLTPPAAKNEDVTGKV